MSMQLAPGLQAILSHLTVPAFSPFASMGNVVSERKLCCVATFSSNSLAWLTCAGYSIWTNHDYKSPLIASAFACLLGNVAYCLSYDLGAVWLLFLARLITGFGEPFHLTASAATFRGELCNQLSAILSRLKMRGDKEIFPSLSYRLSACIGHAW